MTVRRWWWTAIVIAACSGPPTGEPVRVVIPRGSSVSAVADTLTARGIIEHPRWFRLYVKLTGRERSIPAGVFDLHRGLSAGAAVRALVQGGTAQEWLSVPEGLMLSEVAALVEDQLGISAAAFREAAADSALRARVHARGPTLEGYLYPSTYRVEVTADARDVVEQMVDAFEDAWRPEWEGDLDRLGWSRDELVTLASIIEGEARHPADRPYVSSVYHNRLDRGMPLQADPTVIYALGVRRRLFLRDYEVASPYNTYRIDGLPPHPIGQPSTASIEAALYPRRTDFLFFVAGPEGKHVFTRSYREHQAAIRMVRGSGR